MTGKVFTVSVYVLLIIELHVPSFNFKRYLPADDVVILLKVKVLVCVVCV